MPPSNNSPHFLDLPETALQDWRIQPQTDLLVQSLSNDVTESLQACAAHAMRGEASISAWQAGWAACATHIRDAIKEKRQTKKLTSVTTTAEVK
jgi:hypothetical protein